MYITTIMELENKEVESLLNFKTAYDEYKIGDFGLETCIDYYVDLKTNEKVDPATAVDRLFKKFQDDKTFPEDVQNYSYEIPGCDRLKNKSGKFEQPIEHKVIISYTTNK